MSKTIKKEAKFYSAPRCLDMFNASEQERKHQSNAIVWNGVLMRGVKEQGFARDFHAYIA